MVQEKYNINIRKIAVADKLQWQVLWQEYLSFYRADISDAVSDINFDRLVNDKDFYGIVAQDSEGKLLGMMHLIFHPSTWSAAGYCYIEDLYVSPQARGKKVSELLFEKAYEIADSRGNDRVYWMTQEYNAPARSLYDKIGKRSSFVIYMR